MAGEDAGDAERSPLPFEDLVAPPQARPEIPAAPLEVAPAESALGAEPPGALLWPAQEPEAQEDLTSPQLPSLQSLQDEAAPLWKDGSPPAPQAEPEPVLYEQGFPASREKAAWPDLGAAAHDEASQIASQDTVQAGQEEDFSPRPTYVVDSIPGLETPTGDVVTKQTTEDALQALRDLAKNSRDGTISAATGADSSAGGSEEQVGLPTADAPDPPSQTDERIAPGALWHGELAGGSPLAAAAGETPESEGFEILDAALASAMQFEPEAESESPAGPDLFEPALSAEFEEDPVAEHAVSLLSRLTEHEAGTPLEGLDAELPAQVEDNEPAHAAFEQTVLNLSGGEALSSPDAAKELNADVEAEHSATEDASAAADGIARLTETTPPDVEMPSGQVDADGKVLAFPVPAQGATDEPSYTPAEASPPGSDRSRPVDIEPHLELLPIEPKASLGSSQTQAGSDANGASQTEGPTSVLAPALPVAEAPELGVGPLPLESACGPSEAEWVIEAIGWHKAFDSLLDPLTVWGVTEADAPAPVPLLTENEGPMAPHSEAVLPQSLLAGHEPEAPGPGELIVTELILAEPVARDSEAMLEEMDFETQRFSVG